jgi:hypothetical protein
MPARFTDAEIAVYIAERKVLPEGYKDMFKLKAKRGHDECEFDLSGVEGTSFRILLRKTQINPLDFSCILALIPESGALFRLRRYNGKSHQHTNTIERETLYDFHIHDATERYQVLGAREDSFARPTNQYSDLDGALQCMLKECGFECSDEAQADLFGGRPW